MSELRLDSYTMPAANLGPASPLVPVWYDTAELVTPRRPGKGLTDDDVKYIGYGYHEGCLPYFVQDHYDRARKPRTFRTAVLENDVLRATFLLELGGRLWSLVHKPTGRELLHVNPVFQPANLALRNAWFSGGVEWNFCWIGHTPFTCEPIFAARLTADDGAPVLRMWEYERVRGMAYQIDAWLPDGSPVLFVRVRLANLDDRAVPVYWWSNIAVPERPDARVLVPTDCSQQLGKEELVRAGYPCHDGRDYSYTTSAPHSGDRFFRIEPGQYPWIAWVEADGRGFFESSTARLIGRKLWVFGQNPGGRRWQDFLNTPGHPYIEIQGGLTRTQMECLPLPPRTEWEWLEAYGSVETNGRIVHDHDWTAAWRETQRAINANITFEAIERELGRSRAMAERPPEEILQRGSGWGALEWRRRAKAGQKPFCPPSLVFPAETLGPEQAPWLALLETGGLPETSPTQPPVSWMIQDAWREILEASVRKGRSDHWLANLHLGVMYLAQKRYEDAMAAWRRSVEHQPSAWACRMLAALAAHRQDLTTAAEYYPQAVALAPDHIKLVVECAKALIAVGRPAEWLQVADTLPASTCADGHIRILEAQAALAADDLERAGRILSHEFELVNVREGEQIGSDVWFAYQAKRVSRAEGIPIDEALLQRVRREFPPPRHLDFRLG